VVLTLAGRLCLSFGVIYRLYALLRQRPLAHGRRTGGDAGAQWTAAWVSMAPANCGPGAGGQSTAGRCAKRAENDVAERVREARASLEEERSRLAALMADLSQSVVVCNLDGRVLLYNQRAKQELFGRADGSNAELLGLGRSIYTVFDRALIGHALERLQQASRDAGGEAGTARNSSARRSSSPPPVPGACCARTCRRSWAATARTGAQVGGLSITGFVLVLEDVTSTNERHARRDA
jgi:DNA polymerase-3 subunit epsilon